MKQAFYFLFLSCVVHLFFFFFFLTTLPEPRCVASLPIPLKLTL